MDGHSLKISAWNEMKTNKFAMLYLEIKFTIFMFAKGSLSKLTFKVSNWISSFFVSCHTVVSVSYFAVLWSKKWILHSYFLHMKSVYNKQLLLPPVFLRGVTIVHWTGTRYLNRYHKQTKNHLYRDKLTEFRTSVLIQKNLGHKKVFSQRGKFKNILLCEGFS